ncbi:MAG TPA: NAD-dependent epimerase/dehydratase family protein, partial [Thermoanaerobaculia bacterium]
MSAPLCLVTGAPGWLGSRLIEVLRDGLPELPGSDRERRIRCLVLPGTPVSALAAIPADVERIEGDVRDPRSLREFFRGAGGATVFHLCGVINPPRMRDFSEVNVEGTRNVLDAAANAGVARLIAISSNTVAGPNPHPEHLFDERSPRNPRLPYGRSKALMEDLVNDAFTAGRLDTVILRPCRFYGPGQPATRTRFYRMIRQGRMPIFGHGETRWSMSYLDNTCQALLLAERTPRAGGRTYWIADRRPYTVREIVETIETLLENEFGLPMTHRRIRLPRAVGRAASAADDLLQRFGVAAPRIHALSHLQTESACSI